MPYVLGNNFSRCIDRFSNGSPFGVNLKFDPTYQDLRAEIQKLTAHDSLNGRIDWISVRKWSIEILAMRSKDLTVACYLTLALFNLDGYAGMVDGVEILHRYVQEYWEGIYPPSTKPRIAALEWLVTRLAPVVENRSPKPAEVMLLRHLLERLDAFQETVRLQLKEGTPSFKELISALSAHLAALREETSEGEALSGNAVAEISQNFSSQTQRNAIEVPEPLTDSLAGLDRPQDNPTLAVEPESQAGTSASEVIGQIRSLIPVLRQVTPLAPFSYRLLRSLKWDGLTDLPPLNRLSASPDTTRIPAPRPQQPPYLEHLFDTGNWTELLRASEGAFQEEAGTFWLDLQRYTVLALEGLGAPDAAEAVKQEVIRLLERFDTLPLLWFAERAIRLPGRRTEPTIQRTPFAGGATREWLQTLRMDRVSQAPVTNLPLASTAVPDATRLQPLQEQAIQDLLKEKKVAPAFDLIQTALEGAIGQRARFHIRLTAAKIFLEARQDAWAGTLLEELERESGTILHFESWEPEAAVDLYRLLSIYYSRLGQSGNATDREKAQLQIEALRRKLFWLDLRAVSVLEEALRS